MEPGDILDGRYEVRNIWRRVALLLDLSTGRYSVARPATGFASLAAVERLRGVVHPCLPRVLGEAGEEAGRLILFEYLHGIDLETHVRRAGGALDVRRAGAVGLSMARTLCFLHESLDRPLVHLDIKPEHVILSGGVPCLIDFGAAVLLEGERSAPVADPGTQIRESTPVYAAPEMNVWHGPCVQSDIYSLGVTLFAVLGGGLPGPGRLPDLRDLPGGDESAALREVVGRCLLADPAARYPSMAALAGALAAAGADAAMCTDGWI
ncbi:MAG: protein kinase [Clostridiaceae bacterium]|nr:protein kinase [Clostridiaceae bacterium]